MYSLKGGNNLLKFAGPDFDSVSQPLAPPLSSFCARGKLSANAVRMTVTLSGVEEKVREEKR
jgi:hypothetical protein